MRHQILAATSFLVLMAVLYAGAYFSLLTRSVQESFTGLGDAFTIRMHYRVGGDFSRFVFGPINKLDQQLRPGYWTFEGWFREKYTR